ncbi:phosphotransferase family protein [Cellulomonas triticagri]|uniref:Aminoglycoside phosphotransferase family protein n=1 Tax=Cellulomonas triticagri TaxID=2483352 RepID=A0A3M2JFA2_9CELL|nr:aminoglycoside phosphotransferase family protein [Cellulomonas triticagri]RMI12707.1 aminoglycoside phosphotransferase family protein [Cellulomonas triticagri]
MPDAAHRTLSLDTLTRLVAPLGVLVDAARLEGGSFATTYRVTLADGRRVVVKTAPPASGTLFTSEHDPVRTEAMVYGLGATRPELLMPRLLHTDLTRAVAPGDVVVAAFLDGVPWTVAGLEDGAPRTARARADLGALLPRFGTVTGAVFGYPQQPALQAPTWRGAFTAIVTAVLADAERCGADVPADRVRAALAAHGAALDEVTVPRLVHTDLWPGNLFVDPGTGALTGVIDPERALWGDPLLELVGADPADAGLPDVVTAGFDTTSPGARTRLLLGRVWLALVMTTEVTLRGYEGDWVAEYEEGARAALGRALEALGASAVLDGGTVDAEVPVAVETVAATTVEEHL